MHPGSTADEAFPEEFRTLGGLTLQGGAKGSRSVSIIQDICISPVAIRDEHRQRMQEDLGDIKFPDPQVLNRNEPFPHWNQPVAASVEMWSEQLKTLEAWPEAGGPEMATWNRLCASLFYGVLTESLQTQDAVFMAKTEV